MSFQFQSVYLNAPVVLFSQNYLPMTRINLRRAAILLASERAEPLEFSDVVFGSVQKEWVMRSPSTTLNIPEHIRLEKGGKE